MELPPLPVSVPDFIGYANKHPDTQAGVVEAVRPFKAFESKLREIYAQQPDHAAATASHVLPVFQNTPVTVRARDLPSERPAEKEKYLLSLPHSLRRKHGSPAVVDSLKEFKSNFHLFSEASLVDLDWSNICVAGSAVVTSLLPVEAPHNESKRALRTYYHEKLAPASDVDIFLYGLNEQQAVEKVKHIESKIRDSILAETTTVRTKNAITIVSEYPTRHVQIVLRLYKSISEILTGFDVDCSCVAYDGQQVWASPRAIAAFMTQVNSIDLTRRSPSYENRLSKYSHRGFEAYWPGLDRSRIDPTIYERVFSRVKGLARLLVLEKLPSPTDRNSYLAKRREERGRPPLPWSAQSHRTLPGNIKDTQPDDVAEWIEEDDVSDYHTITLPYGPRYNAKKIEKLLFTKDLLLNAEWNKPKDRKTNLHRHPAFFGSADDVIHDCCGFCPEPTSDEDLAAFEEESKIYISGDLTFLKDNPGRQAIGSFNPVTDEDWTEMAYIGNTTRLCQAIVEQDLDAVQDWFSSLEQVDVNRRDHTGRTPLQLAVMCSTPEIVQCLIEHGARLVSRLYNGMTALHIAAHRGDSLMVKALLDRSAANEEQETRKEEARRQARRAAAGLASEMADEVPRGTSDTDSWSSDEDMDDDDGGQDHVTEGSFVNIVPVSDALGENNDDPDVYNVDVLAWDSPLSPLHLAILGGHLEVIDLLIDEYGADAILPVKIMDGGNPKKARAVILTLSLALERPLKEANQTIQTLLAHGATFAQADMNHISALHYTVSSAKVQILETFKAANPVAFRRACDLIAVSGYYYGDLKVETPLLTAIRTGREDVAVSLIANGARTHIDFESFAQAYKRSFDRIPDMQDRFKQQYDRSVNQPVTAAMMMELVDLVNRLIDSGEDVNTLPANAHLYLQIPSLRYSSGSLLDIVRRRMESLQRFLNPLLDIETEKLEPLGKDEDYLDLEKGTYQYWTACHDLQDAKLVRQYQIEQNRKHRESLTHGQEEGIAEKKVAVQATLVKLGELESKLVEKGAKPIAEMYPDLDFSRPKQWAPPLVNDSPYTTNLSFKVGDLTPEKKVDYIKLFEAAWKGDAETVRFLCLSSPHPLQVAVQDLRGFSPFSIAALCGHYELAQLIVEIATVQYQPDNKWEQYHYTLRTEIDYDDHSEYDEGRDDVPVLAQVVDERFTIDNVAALADTVKSKVAPETMVSWLCQVDRAFEDVVDKQEARKALGGDVTPSAQAYGRPIESWAWFHSALENVSQARRCSLIRYAIVRNNVPLLKFLVKLGNGLAKQKEDDETLKVVQIDKEDFAVAIRLGRIEMIEEMIKSTGVGIPLQKMSLKSGIKIDIKPKYYQGLTVHGKKRQDWAEASRLGSRRNQTDTDGEIPLLVSIMEGNPKAIEYFLSDAPLRGYLEFAKGFEDNEHIRALAQGKGGVQAALTTWLSAGNDLALHVAVLSPPNTDGSQASLDFLLSHNVAGCLEARSADGRTPLYLAFEVGRYYAAKRLIEVGANVRTKDDAGRNILHVLLDHIHHRHHVLLRSIFEMLDREVVAEMLVERCGGTEPTGMTPLALFLSHIDIKTKTGWEHSLQLLLSYSQGKDLEKMDGAGDYALHSVARREHQELVKFIVDYRPGLLYYENATGMTPSEVVTTSYLRYVVEHPPQLVQTSVWSIVDKPAREFVKRPSSDTGEGPTTGDEDGDEDANQMSQAWKMNRLVNGLMSKYPARRKLVGLHDANEVSKRLALQEQKKNEEAARLEKIRGRNGEGRDVETHSNDRDPVGMYLDRAKKATPWDQLVWRREAGDTVEEGEMKYEGPDRWTWSWRRE